MYVQDNLDRFEQHDAEQEKKEKNFTCEHCGEEVGEYYYDIDGEIICENCIEKYRRSSY